MNNKTAPLLGGGDSPQKTDSKLSLGMVVRIKSKTRDWRNRAHDHAMDQAMAIGFGDFTAGKHAENRWGAVDETEEKKWGEKSYVDVSGQTNTEAVMNLLNNCLGSGVLCVPIVFKNCGVVAGTLMLVISAILNRFGLMLILKCMYITGVEASYNGVGRVAFGNTGRLAVVAIFVAMGFGCLVSYVDATADAVGDLIKLATGNSYSKLSLQLGCILVLYPPTYIRSLKNVVPISIASFIGALIVVACVSVQCIKSLATDGIQGQIRLYPENPMIFLKSIPTTLTVMSIQAGGSITMSALQDSSDANKGKVSLIAYMIVFLVDVSIGLPAYLRFLDDTAGNVLSSLSPTAVLTIIAKVMVLDLVVPSYMFMMIPCRVALIELLFGKNEAKQEATWMQFFAVTTGVNIAAVAVATAVADLSLVIGLVGAIAANSVAFILPSLFYMKARSTPVVEDEDYPPSPFWSVKNIGFYCLVVFSLFSMVSGVYFLLTG